MGNPFKSTETYQYWNIATSDLTDKTVPDSFDEFATINELVNGIDYWSSMDYLNSFGGARNTLRQTANKFKKSNFFGGFADVEIGSNYAPLELIKYRINPSDPSKVNIKSSSVTPLNYTGWVVNHLINTFQFNKETNTFIRDGIPYSVDLTTANSADNTVEYVNVITNFVYILDIPPEPVGAAYNVTYTLTYIASHEYVDDDYSELVPIYAQTPESVWQYWIASGKYPELDTFTKISDDDPTTFQVFPPIDIRRNGQSYPNFDTHDDHDEYAKALGINSKELAGIFENEDGSGDTQNMTMLDHVTVNQGIKLQAKDKHSIKYCIDFITKLKALADTHNISSLPYDNNSSTSVWSDLNDTSFKVFGAPRYFTGVVTKGDTVTSNETPMEIIEVPGVDLIISHDEFSYGLKYSRIYIGHHTPEEVENNAILKDLRDTPVNEKEHGKVITTIYKSILSIDLTTAATEMGISNLSADNDSSGIISRVIESLDGLSTRDGNTISYYAIHKDGSIDSYSLVQPVMAHYVKDAQSGKHALVYIDLETEDANVYLPIDYKILDGYTNQAATSLVTSSLHLTMYYAYWEQKEEWDFGVITAVIMILLYLYCQPCAAAMTKYWAGLGPTLQMVVIGATLAAMGVFGEKYVLAGKVVLLVVSLGSSSYTFGFNLGTASAALSVIDIMNTYNMQHELALSEGIANEMSYEQDKWEKEMELLDDELVSMGYYKNKRKRKYVQQALININKKDVLRTMSPKEYFYRNKKSVSARYQYQLQYNYV